MCLNMDLYAHNHLFAIKGYEIVQAEGVIDWSIIINYF